MLIATVLEVCECVQPLLSGYIYIYIYIYGVMEMYKLFYKDYVKDKFCHL